MFRLLIIISVILLGSPIGADVAFDASKNFPLNLEKHKLIRFAKGDSLEYKKKNYDDSQWSLVVLPHRWHSDKDGESYGWYRFRIILPETKNKSWALYCGIIVDADEVYFNEKLIGKTGEVRIGGASDYDKKRIYEIPQNLIEKGKENLFAIRVSSKFPDVNGLAYGSFYIGPYNSLMKRFYLHEILNMILMTIYCAVSLYFGIFFHRISDNKEYLFFSLFSIVTAAYLFLQSQVKYFLTDDFVFLKRLEYLVLMFSFVLFFEFITFLFKKKHSVLHYCFFLITLFSSSIIIVSSDLVIWSKVLYYIIQPSWLLPIGYYMYIFYTEIKGKREALYIMIALLFVLASVINDIFINRGIFSFVKMTRFSFIILLIGISVYLHKRMLFLTQRMKEAEDKISKKSSLSSQSVAKMEEAAAHIKESFSENITREELAKSLAMNADNLGKMFRRHFGKTITEYKNELQVDEAKKLLVSTDHSIIDIAFTVGFESQSTFYRIFQKAEGISPNQYRNENID